ncbi:enoyl-CoA hydratase [Thecamonas trahens ATCC 50062]|uniref:Enoyl-CoA hydratase n=1 Tax=Thecamonas trahens ATCC 50062 TaxID=461836 RepID=A0A0L0DM64_THETB|nr:enoyl-CoA hydratase [Thecamonas trahens ATCC 50062]KNC53402.1 enoyl-CoA hydratase [Thecamonas trahens ATCC 50062]|eukprot:XP_013754441.1 enoyl-CoA hydratase [Thecamonas trahens ATCC 50062]
MASGRKALLATRLEHIVAETDEAHAGLVWVTLNRPEVRNGLSFELVAELHAVLDELAGPSRETARVVILSGAGKGFCAGANLKSLMSKVADYQLEDQRTMSRLILKIRAAPQIFIAAIHGGAAGAGLSLALACDVRVAAKDLKMNCAFVLLGLSGAEMGCSFFLPKLVGPATASEMMLTGRFMHADEAAARGLVTKVLADREAALAEAQSRNQRQRFGGASLAAAIAMEDRQQVLCLKDDDCLRVGIKYAARFLGPSSKL